MFLPETCSAYTLTNSAAIRTPLQQEHGCVVAVLIKAAGPKHVLSCKCLPDSIKESFFC